MSRGEGKFRVLFELQTRLEDFETIRGFLKCLLCLFPSFVLRGRLCQHDECVGGWLFTDKVTEDLLPVGNQPVRAGLRNGDKNNAAKPQFIGFNPISRTPPPGGLSHLYNGHDLWSDALNSTQRDTEACKKLGRLHYCRIIYFGHADKGDLPIHLLCKQYLERGELEVGDIALISYNGELVGRFCGLQNFQSDGYLDIRL
ncbi:hypothetical protein N7451_012538 [Penicillium sp. IBT 35674x]|nr:hypothetical protein N7451_012538 [Penicillium sp. IBT 35674x]